MLLDPNELYSTYLGYSARKFDPTFPGTMARSLGTPTIRPAATCHMEDLVVSEGIERARKAVEDARLGLMLRYGEVSRISQAATKRKLTARSTHAAKPICRQL